MMRKMKLMSLLIGASILVACDGAASTDETEDKPEKEVAQQEVADETTEETIESAEIDESVEEPKEAPKVESSESDNLVPDEQNTPEALKKAVEQIDSLNQTLYSSWDQGDAYETLIPTLTDYVTDAWIQDFEASYVDSEADVHNGFIPYRVDNDLNYWFDYQIDGTTATVTTFLHGNDYAGFSVDLDVQLKYEDNRWKIDQLMPSIDYLDLEKGKNFTVEEIQGMLEATTDAQKVMLIDQGEEEIFQGPGEEPTIEMIYEFEVTRPDGSTDRQYYSAYDGMDMMMTLGL